MLCARYYTRRLIHVEKSDGCGSRQEQEPKRKGIDIKKKKKRWAETRYNNKFFDVAIMKSV